MDDAEEGGLVSEVEDEEEHGVECDPDRCLEEHGQAAERAGELDVFFLEEFGHFLAEFGWVVLVFFLEFLLLWRECLELLAELVHPHLAELCDRVEDCSDAYDQEDDRERPVEDEVVVEDSEE